jgi:hypothetical protein
VKVWLDDERPAPDGWVHVRTARDCIAVLETGGVTELSLDHDLGPVEAGTGYEVACWLEEHPKLAPPAWRCECHSANPIGRSKIYAALRKLGALQ